MKKPTFMSYVAAGVFAVSSALSSSASGAELPPDSEYITVNEKGHLIVNGERKRFWAVIGKPFISAKVKKGDDAATKKQKLEKSRKGTDRVFKHMQDTGFNSVRLWNVVPNTDGYTVGDGSHADCVDYFLKKCRDNGWKVWVAGIGNRVGKVTRADVNVIDDPATADAWMAAVDEYNVPKKNKKGKFRPIDIRHSKARIWDPRIEAVYINRMRANAQHFNKHTGLRWSDDPTIGIWELTNEEWWMRRMLGGGWLKEPKFFRDSLIAKWNAYLQDKYKDDAALTKAWKKLLPGESVKTGNIMLAPMAGKSDPSLSMNDSNPHAREALMGSDSEFRREDFDRQRGADVIEFFLGLKLAHKARCAAAMRTFGKAPKLGVVVHDTGIGYNIQSQYMHQKAGVSVHDAYVNGWGPKYEKPDLSQYKTENRRRLKELDSERISANTEHWVNWLLKPPGISQGVPWLEHNRAVGQPYLVYETQIQQPAKYRADFPLRIAALASIQDWDWISWHYFAPPDDAGLKDKPFNRPVDVTTGGHPQGYHYTYDEVQNALMRQAAVLWVNQHLDPAPNPTTFIYGKKSLTDPASMDYAGSYHSTGFDMLQTVYQHGVRIKIDPTRDDDEVIGPVVKYEDRNTHNPYTPTKAITFDWKKGFLKFDDDQSSSFTGLLAKYGEEVKFSNGTVLKNVNINNPEGSFSPVTDDEKYIAFSFVSEDGKPLAQTQKASIALQSTSFNTGFWMDSKATLEKGRNKAKSKAGGMPVLVSRVAATVQSPGLKGMTYTYRDWNMDVIGTGKVAGDSLDIPNDKPIFIIELSR